MCRTTDNKVKNTFLKMLHERYPYLHFSNAVLKLFFLLDSVVL